MSEHPVNYVIAVRGLKQWAKQYKMTDCPAFVSFLQELYDQYESESIIVDEHSPSRPQGFIWLHDGWHPVHVMNKLCYGWAEWRMDTPNGCSSGTSGPGKWADINMDNRLSLPFGPNWETTEVHGSIVQLVQTKPDA